MNLLSTLPKEKLQKLILVGVFALIAEVVLCYLWVGKQWSSLQSRRDKISELQAKVSQAERSSQKGSAGEQDREEIVAFVEAQRATMVTGDPFLWVVREISLMAERHPVKIVSLQPGAKSQHPRRSRYEVYATRIELTGSYDQVGFFVSDLENKFPEAEIRSLEITGGDTSGQQYRASIELALLVQPELSPVSVPTQSKNPEKAAS